VKRSFDLFGSRHELIDKTHPFLAGVIDVFNRDYASTLDKFFRKEFSNEREIIVFGEYFGAQSFAGLHVPGDPTMQFVMFDVLVGHKTPKFILPQEFIKMFTGVVKIAREVYRGNLNDQLIKDVREGKYDVFEGVLFTAQWST
jgi:hypothetical protein